MSDGRQKEPRTETPAPNKEQYHRLESPAGERTEAQKIMDAFAGLLSGAGSDLADRTQSR